MRPRRPIYAEDYIAETVALYAELVNKCAAGARDYTEDIKWGRRTLGAYFALTSGSEVIEAARREFEGIVVPQQLQVNGPPPVQRPDAAQYTFGVEDLLVVARSRHSIRRYLQKSVPREGIDAAVAVALESPSACNRQAFSFRLFDEPELVRQIAAIPMGIDVREETIPLLVVVVGDLGAYPEPRDRHLIYIDASLAAMAFVLALQVQGIGTCCVNWPEIGHLEEKMRKTIGLSESERPTMLISAGYPDPGSDVPSSRKRALEQMRFYNSITMRKSQDVAQKNAVQ